MKKVFLLLIFIGLLSCKKYKDDSFLSIRSPSKRLEAYFWVLSSYKINGADSTSNYLNPNPNQGRYPTLSFEYVKDCAHCGPGYNIYQGSSTGDIGGWSLINNEQQLNLSYANVPGKLFPFKTDWDILELYKSNFKISCTHNGKYYELKFTGNAKMQ